MERELTNRLGACQPNEESLESALDMNSLRELLQLLGVLVLDHPFSERVLPVADECSNEESAHADE